MIREYSNVEIVQIDGDPASRVISSSYDPPKFPKTGDRGIRLDAQSDGSYIVESVEPDGYTSWLAWFYESELVAINEPEDR